MSKMRYALLASCCTVLSSASLDAQGSATAAPPQVNLSGIVMGSFQYRTDDAARAVNRFELDRAYLTVRMPAGERASIRITTDVYQQTAPNDAYYRGWAIRAKYAYLQYDFLKGKEWSAYSRMGMLNTVVVEHIEAFWPRFLSQVAIERAGFFSSADLGLSANVTLPHKFGEVMAVVTNGPGYTARETDRFKDYAARLTVTPLSASHSIARSLTLSAWGYKGALGSRFASPAAGQLEPINEALQRDRYGVFAGLKDARFTLGAEWAQRLDEGEAGANTAALPRTVTDSSGDVRSAFIVARPLQIIRGDSTSPFGIVLRRDWVTTNRDRDTGHSVTIAGLLWDLTKRTTVSLDYQVQVPRENTVSPVVKTAFLHFAASF